MKAIILAAGTGSRLRPLTDNRPKCLVPLRGVPLLDYQLHTLRTNDVHDISLVTGYLSSAFAPYGLPTFENPRYETTNMVHSLFCAEEEFDDDLIVFYGDIVVEPRVLQSLIASQDDFAVVIDKGWSELWQRRMADPLTDAESLKIDASGCIRDIGKKVRSLDEIQGQYIGLFKISRDCLAKVSAFYKTLDRQAIYDGKPFEKMFMTSFIQQLIESGMPIKPVYTTHGWLEVDTYEDWQFYEALPPDDALFHFELFNDRVLASR